MMKTTIYRGHNVLLASFCMTNIPLSVPEAQKNVFRNFGWEIVQCVVDKEHWEVLDFFVSVQADVYLIFDVDCVPLRQNAIEDVLDCVLDHDALVGIEQTCNHLPAAEGHIYAGPSCICFSKKLYDRLGRPSFAMTHKGDVGQEFTYRAQALNCAIELIRLKNSKNYQWRLGHDRMFGNGSNYADMFYHQFQIRYLEQMHDFLNTTASICKVEKI